MQHKNKTLLCSLKKINIQKTLPSCIKKTFLSRDFIPIKNIVSLTISCINYNFGFGNIHQSI